MTPPEPGVQARAPGACEDDPGERVPVAVMHVHREHLSKAWAGARKDLAKTGPAVRAGKRNELPATRSSRRR